MATPKLLASGQPRPASLRSWFCQRVTILLLPILVLISVPSCTPTVYLDCEEDLQGVGSLNSTCHVSTGVYLTDGTSWEISGPGSLILANGSISCDIPNAELKISMGDTVELLTSGTFIMGGVVVVEASFIRVATGAYITSAALSKEQPSQTSGTPSGLDGAGGGYGGRGASCMALGAGDPSEVWGGDSYGWSNLQEPWKFGSPGAPLGPDGSGGLGGGLVNVTASDSIELNGTIIADGGTPGFHGGGGSGGSVIVSAREM